MNSERILRIADTMEMVKPSRYLQSMWAGDVSSRQAEFKKVGDNYILVPKEGFCGSAACVLGHGAMTPDTGLSLFVDMGSVVTRGGRRFAEEVCVGAIIDGEVSGEVTGFEAAVEALGISIKDSYVLFSGGGSTTLVFYSGATTAEEVRRIRGREFNDVVTPQKVAAALRRYVETGGQSAALARELAKHV